MLFLLYYTGVIHNPCLNKCLGNLYWQ
uniref:Uncharacterized protein n=1 Tax=Rhizophora mucronata TaxID=61149 RepID=A0A2P2Q2Q5_RHIMU